MSCPCSHPQCPDNRAATMTQPLAPMVGGVIVVSGPETKRAQCGKCGSTLEFTVMAERVGESSDYLGDTDYYKFVTCPTCGGRVVTHRQSYPYRR